MPRPALTLLALAICSAPALAIAQDDAPLPPEIDLEFPIGCEMSQLMTDEELAKDNINLREKCGFELFNECHSVYLMVRVQELAKPLGAPEPPDISRLEDRLSTMAESRLRAARLYGKLLTFSTSQAAPMTRGTLSVEVSRYDGSYLTTVDFLRRVFDPVSKKWSVAPTWRATDTRYRFPFSTSDSVMQNVSDGIDRFILEYLRVNEAAC